MLQTRFSVLAAGFLALSLFLAPAPLSARSAEPEWVGNPYADFNERAYIVAVGSGLSRQAAETDAIRRIAAVFHMSIHAVQELTTLSRQTVVDGAAAWTQDTELRSAIESVVIMDNIMGAGVRRNWYDGRGSHFALATLNRAASVRLYSDMVRANLDIIDSLTGMPPAQRNTFDGFSRYRFAATFADVSFSYGQMLVVLGAPWGEPLRTGAYFLERSREILTEIQIGINVNNDRGQRIGGAFAQAVSGLGFRTAGTNPRFVLNVIVNTWRDEHLVQGAEFTWIEIGANLTDRNTGAVLLPYGFTLRGQPHFTAAAAENLAVNAAVQRIAREYGNLLAEYLAGLIPQR